MTQLGGHALFVDWAASNFVLTELDYEIEYLSRNVEGMARLLSQDDIATMCASAKFPLSTAVAISSTLVRGSPMSSR